MGGYRDETEGLRARVTELEGKLAAAEARIAELRGHSVERAAELGGRSGVLNAPMGLRFERELPYAVSTEGLEAIAELLRRRLRLEASQVGRRLRGTNITGATFELRVEDGRTSVRLEGSWRARHRSFFVGVPAGAFMAGVFAAAGLSMLGVSGLGLALGALLIGLGGGVGLGALVRGIVADEQLAVAGTFAALLELAAEHAVAAPAVRVAEPGEDVAVDEATVSERERALS